MYMPFKRTDLSQFVAGLVAETNSTKFFAEVSHSLLAKIALTKLPLNDLKVLVELFNGCIIDICQSSCTVEITGTGERLDAFVEACGRTQISELVRSGVSGITRGT